MDKGVEIKLDDYAFHPGEELAEKLQEMELSPEEFAEQTHLDVQYINEILAHKASVTAETAVAFEMVTKIPTYLWLAIQHDYDDYLLKNKKESLIEQFLSFSRRTAAVL